MTNQRHQRHHRHAQRQRCQPQQASAGKIARQAIDIRFRAAPQTPAQPCRQPQQQRCTQQQPLKLTALHTVRNIDGRTREDPRQEVERRPEDAADNIRHYEFCDRQIQHPGDHGNQRTRGADKAADENGKHAVLVQRMLGFIQQGFVLFHERPAVQRLLKAPAQPEGDPVAQQTADDPGQPRLPEIDLTAANQRAKPCHHHGAGQD